MPVRINETPPPEAIKTEIAYDPKTGHFTWLTPRRGRHPGRPAGNLTKDGYRTIMLDGQAYAAHRLSWWFATGEWPSVQIDHKNGRPDDNWIDNLRLATPEQNSSNRKIPSTNTTGLRGVNLHHKSGRWNANIGDGGKLRFLGSFMTARAAALAYDAAAIAMRGEFASLNFPEVSLRRANDGLPVEGRIERTTYRKKGTARAAVEKVIAADKRKRAASLPIATPAPAPFPPAGDWGDIVRAALRDDRVIVMDLHDYPAAA